MTEHSHSQSFWATLPGILTAFAAVITAVGGTVAILLQVGIIGGAGKSPPQEQIDAHATTSAPAATSSPTAGTAAGKPWRDVEAVFTAKDGTATRMRAETVRFCISTGTGIILNESQNIAFERMSRIEVRDSDEALAPGGKATLRVGLADGTTLAGTITSGCDFFGQSKVGRYSLYPDKLQTIEFRR